MMLRRTLHSLRRPAIAASSRGLCVSPPHIVEHDGTRAQRSLILLKPDAVERRLVGRLLQRFEERGLALVGMRQRIASRELAEAHYEEHRGKVFFERACVFITSGPLISVCVEGRGAIGVTRSLVGPTDPVDAPPGTIRGDLATHWRRNLVHASDSEESAAREIGLWFRDDELMPAASALDPWLYETPQCPTTF